MTAQAFLGVNSDLFQKAAAVCTVTFRRMLENLLVLKHHKFDGFCFESSPIVNCCLSITKQVDMTKSEIGTSLLLNGIM